MRLCPPAWTAPCAGTGACTSTPTCSAGVPGLRLCPSIETDQSSRGGATRPFSAVSAPDEEGRACDRGARRTDPCALARRSVALLLSRRGVGPGSCGSPSKPSASAHSLGCGRGAATIGGRCVPPRMSLTSGTVPPLLGLLLPPLSFVPLATTPTPRLLARPASLTLLPSPSSGFSLGPCGRVLLP